MRSNIPPCPGIIDPVSLILAFLLKNEISKSPNWEANETTNIKIISFTFKFKWSTKCL